MPMQEWEEITSITNQKYVIDSYVNKGGQGTVYTLKGTNKVVKLYETKDKYVQESLLNKFKMIRTQLLNANIGNFIQIEDIIESPKVGYVMEDISSFIKLGDKLYHNSSDSFSAWYKSWGLEKRLLAGLGLARAFRKLHACNLTYCDIAPQNIYFEEREMDNAVAEPFIRCVLIDLDNIYIAGSDVPSVMGTKTYIAPEVLSGHIATTASDDYSLAVVLFCLLCVRHPFGGKEIDGLPPEKAQEILIKQEKYVDPAEDPSDHLGNVVLTEKLKKLFKTMFTKGKINPNLRPTALQMECALLEAYYNLTRCPNCGAWHYPDNVEHQCPWCEEPSDPTRILQIYFASRENGKEVKVMGEKIHHYILKEGVQNLPEYYVDFNPQQPSRVFVQFEMKRSSDRKTALYILNKWGKDIYLWDKNKPSELGEKLSTEDRLIHCPAVLYCLPEGLKQKQNKLKNQEYPTVVVMRVDKIHQRRIEA